MFQISTDSDVYDNIVSGFEVSNTILNL